MVDTWLAPIGATVTVRRDNGESLVTVTTSDAFLVDGKHAFIRVRGIPGNVRLSRVTVGRVKSSPA
jgi:hypothetical protein